MLFARDRAGVFFDEGARYTIARSSDAAAPGDADGRTLERHEARWALERLLGQGKGAEIVAVYGAFLRGPLRATDEADVRRMRDALLDAVDRGWLRVSEAKLVGASTRREVDEADTPATAAGPAKEEEKTWIEIVLTYDDGPHEPVPFARYRIELPDGSTREGMLDERGRARLEGIDPGTCQVTFPRFDRREWSAA